MPKKQDGTSTITMRVPGDVKQELTARAIKKGMDVTKLSRAMLINSLHPGTYDI